MEFMQPDPIGWGVTQEGREETGTILTYPELKEVNGVVDGYCIVLWGEADDVTVSSISSLRPIKKKEEKAGVSFLREVPTDDTTH